MVRSSIGTRKRLTKILSKIITDIIIIPNCTNVVSDVVPNDGPMFLLFQVADVSSVSGGASGAAAQAQTQTQKYLLQGPLFGDWSANTVCNERLNTRTENAKQYGPKPHRKAAGDGQDDHIVQDKPVQAAGERKHRYLDIQYYIRY